MAKLTLSNITSGYATATATNTNNDLIETAIENTLSRDGTAPNTMEANIDMNSYKVINLAAPTNNNDAARLVDIGNAPGYAAAALVSQDASAASAAASAASAAASAASAAAALVSENNAAASYDSFDDRYLGSKASAPTLDNDGNALLVGAIYWNSTSSILFVWNGSTWFDPAGGTSASSITNTPAGNIAATNVQTALNELDTEKALLAGSASQSFSVLDLNLAGGQIQFPATQVASTNVNTLDDYEEGTWAPAVGGTATYNEQKGKYVKIGKQVTVWGQIWINVLGTGSATTITGLPFTPDAAYEHTGTAYWLSSATAVTTLFSYISVSSIFFFGCTAAAVSATAQNVFADGTRIKFTVTYTV